MKTKPVKRSLALLLCLAMLFTLLPCSAMAADPESITVYATVSKGGNFVTGKDAAIIGYVSVTVTDRNENGTYDIDDTFKALHERYYDGTDGYEKTGEGSVRKFWGNVVGGDSGNNVSYYLNDTSVYGLTENVQANDHLYLFFFQDIESWSDVYCYFDTSNKVVTKDSPVDFTLSTIGLWDTEASPLEGAQITIDGVEQEDKITDADGKVSLSFAETGEFIVSATADNRIITPPVCMVQVGATAPEPTKTDEELVADAKEALTAAAPLAPNALDNNIITLAQSIVDRAARGVTVASTVSTENTAVAADGKVTFGAEAVNGNVTFSLSKGEVVDSATVSVAVPPKVNVDMADVLQNIAAEYAANGAAGNQQAPWIAADMMAYLKAYPETAHKLLATQKQAMLNESIAAIEAAAKPGDVAKHIIALVAMGYDPTKLTTVNSTEINAVEKLNKLSFTDEGTVSVDVYTLPHVLVAYQQFGDVYKTQIDKLVSSALGSTEEWMDTSWGPDTAATMIMALAPYYTNDQVKEAVDPALDLIKNNQESNGSFKSFGPGASSGLSIVAFAALGIDPSTVKSDENNTLLDGLMLHVDADKKGFDNNDFGKEQGFRGLVACHAMTIGTPYHIYDFSGNSLQPGRATTNEESETPPVLPEENPEETETITVYLSIKVNNSYWLPKKAVTVDEGSYVSDVLIEGIEGTGITQKGAESGYVSEMSYNGTTLGEFTEGELTGWLYKVNDSAPMIGVDAYEVEDGDEILFYYTMDYTQDSSSSGFVEKPQVNKEDQAAADEVSKLITAIGIVDANSAEKIKAARAAYDKLTDEQKELVAGLDKLIAAEKKLAALTGALPFSDVAEKHWANDAIRFVFANDLMDGIGDGKFAPDTTLSRAMVLTMLYRLAGEPAYAADKVKEFSDVKAGLWYSDAINWAVANNIVIGYDDGTMGTNDDISREQLAVMLYRFAELVQHKSTKTADISTFADIDTVGSYAADALKWANGNGFITGRDNNLLAPKGDTLRGEAATVLMRYCETFAVFAATK